MCKKEDNKNNGRLSSSVCAADSTDLILWVCKPILNELSTWLASDDFVGEDALCGGPGLAWLQVVCSCEAS